MAYNALTDGVLEARHAASQPAPSSGVHPVPLDAPAGDANLWVPIGPSIVVNGQAGGRPRVAGRVRDLAISPDGMRVYAATANGGVWYSADSGTTWSPLGNWNPTPPTVAIDRPAQELTCGCLLVQFGAAADGSGDDVYVGTGELIPGTSQTPVNMIGGVGVLHLDSFPAALSDPFGAHWKREAKNLTGAGIYRMARDPNDANTLVAATSIGFYKRTGVFVEDSDWTLVHDGPFAFDAYKGKKATDVAWASNNRLWVAVPGRGAGQDDQIFTSPSGLGGSWQGVPLLHVTDLQGTVRLGLAVAPSDPTVVYVLGSGPGLWRFSDPTPDGAYSIPPLVSRIFFQLFGDEEGDQSSYDLAITVHPDNANIVVLGGKAVWADDAWSASLFRHTITTTPVVTADFVTDNFDKPDEDPTYIGNGIHSDVHQIKFVKVGGDLHMWVACDGGVFRSRDSGNRYSFVAANSGLAVLQPGFVMGHPENDAFVITGTQDNGVLLRVGDTVWMHTRPGTTPAATDFGDAGCVLFHPLKSRYFAAQYNKAAWNSNGTLPPPVFREIASTSETQESNRSFFYSTADVRAVGVPPQAQLAIGTNRVWLADDWDPDPFPFPGLTPNRWVTLPSNHDPRDRNGPAAGADVNTDTYGERSGKVVACRWLDDDRLVVLMRSGSADGQDSVVLLYKRTNGNWEPVKELSKHVNRKSDYTNSDIPQPTSSYLPPLGAWSDLAVHAPTRLPNGSFYVATTGHVKVQGANVIESDRMDTLWWYDGDSTWHPTLLRTKGTKAPAYAVVRDPGDDTVVYVGTTLGVWKGVLSFPDGNPNWEWQKLSNGLPEATVDDLSVYQKGSIKLLRAAVHARGVWEVDISAAPSPIRRTFLRVHANDARRTAAIDLFNPMLSGPNEWPWHGSPDVRIRPAPLSGGETPPPPPMPAAAPWVGGAPDPFQLWIYQTALHKTDPLCRPTGLWTAQFGSRLTANRITRDNWTATVTAANVFAPPWDGLAPTEGDLFELVLEDGQSSDPSDGPPAISMVKKRRYNIDVMVHYRDLRPLAAASVRVTLLRLELPADQNQWAGIAITDAWKTQLAALMAGGATAPVGWTLADSTSPTLTLSADIDARLPRPVTFTVNFAGAPTHKRYVLLAVVSSVPDPITAAALNGANLKDLILNNHHFAARVVEAKA
jgi:hypothetical protein